MVRTQSSEYARYLPWCLEQSKHSARCFPAVAVGLLPLPVLRNKQHKFRGQKPNHFVRRMDSVGQRFRKHTARMAHLCSRMSGTSTGKVRNRSYPSGWELVSPEGSFSHMSGAWPGRDLKMRTAGQRASHGLSGWLSHSMASQGS